MRILALDASGLVASVAVMDEGRTVAEYTIDYKKTHSQTLLPMICEILKMTETPLSSTDAIAVSQGPGSFTGLRIGAATAKGLGLALNKPLIQVPTLEAMAYNLYGYAGLICPMMDARREQVYFGVYEFADGKLTVIHGQDAAPVREVTALLNGTGRNVICLGDGADAYAGQIKDEIRVPLDFAPAGLNRQRASLVGKVGMLYFAEGRAVPSCEFKLDYIRPSSAKKQAFV